MDYTVSDFYSTFEEKLVLLNGQNGFEKPVTSVGLLDYEMDPAVKDRFIGDNFQPGQLILSSLLFAKQNPFLVADAVRHLIDKGCSALVVRNVFDLPFAETTLRYADSKGFPIFQIKGRDIYFEDLVYEVARRKATQDSLDSYNDELNILLHDDLSPAERVSRIRNVIPSLRSSCFFACARPQRPVDRAAFEEALQRYRESPLFKLSNKLLSFDGQLLFAFSSDTLTQDYNKGHFNAINDLLNICCRERLHVGISAPHYQLSEVREAIRESQYAAVYGSLVDADQTLYDQIGVFKLILPYCRTGDYKRFCDHILAPLRDYDIENNTQLIETLDTYVRRNGSIKKTAEVLGHHENTIRYRFETILQLCGLDYKNPQDNEQLCMAVKVQLAVNAYMEKPW